MTNEDNVARLLSAIEKQGEDFRADLGAVRKDLVQQVVESERRSASRFTKFAAEYDKKLQVTAEVAEAARRRVSDISELAAKTKEHQSSSDLEAEARHAALIEDKARKELEMRTEIASLNAKFDTFTQPKNGSATPLTLAKIDENGRKRGAATWLAVVLAALGVAGKAVDLVTSSAAAKQPYTTQPVQP